MVAATFKKLLRMRRRGSSCHRTRDTQKTQTRQMATILQEGVQYHQMLGIAL